MKLIIDIPYEAYYTFKCNLGKGNLNALAEIVANGTPYEESTQGEWVAREDMDYLDENKVVHNHFMCNKCGLIHDFIDGHTSQYNFCPQCGAKMQKGGAE